MAIGVTVTVCVCVCVCVLHTYMRYQLKSIYIAN